MIIFINFHMADEDTLMIAAIAVIAVVGIVYGLASSIENIYASVEIHLFRPDYA